MLEKLRQLEIARLSLVFDSRPEASLVRHALLIKQKTLIRDVVNIAGSISDRQMARSFAQSLYVVAGEGNRGGGFGRDPRHAAEVRDAFRELTSDPVLWSYLDIIEASRSSDEIFVGSSAIETRLSPLSRFRLFASTGHADAEGMAAETPCTPRDAVPFGLTTRSPESRGAPALTQSSSWPSSSRRRVCRA